MEEMKNPTTKQMYIVASLICLSIIFAFVSIFVNGKKTKDVSVKALSFQKGIAVVPVEGFISLSRSRDRFWDNSSSSAERILEDIEYFMKKPSVGAIVLSINTPGGTAVSAYEVYQGILKLREKYDKPIIASMREVAASGGYFIALAADTIVASPGTLTGSIGVILSVANYTGSMEKLGLKYYTFESGKNKDMLSPFRPLNNEEISYMNSMIEGQFAEFKNAVITRRAKTLSESSYSKVFDGRIFSGRDAWKIGLIDALGSEKEAITLAAQEAGLEEIDNPPIIEYDKEDLQRRFMRLFSAFANKRILSLPTGVENLLAGKYVGVPLFYCPMSFGGE